jgi:ATP-dependent Clp protease ATP-binding subunit ClpC
MKKYEKIYAKIKTLDKVDVIKYIAEKGFDEKYGARPLRRAIQKYLEDPLAEEIINSQIKPGDTLHVDFDTELNEVKMHVEKGTSAAE